MFDNVANTLFKYILKTFENSYISPVDGTIFNKIKS